MNDCFQKSGMMILAIPVVLLFAQVCSAFPPTVSMSISGNISYMEMTPGSTNQNSSVSLNITSDTPNWTVSVKDASDASKPPLFAGRMVEWNSATSEYVTNPEVLGSNMTVMGTTMNDSIGSSVTLSGENRIIETGTANVTFLVIPLTFEQTVTYTDQHLTLPNHVYRIVVTFTGAVT